MRVRIGLLMVLVLLAMVFAGCNDDNNDFPFSSDETYLKAMFIGNVPIQVGGTHNVPLAFVDSMRFELTRPVTLASLAELFEYQITIHNLDTDMTYLVTDANLDENGELYWVDEDTIEYRLFHPMNVLVAGGQNYSMGSPGDTFRINVIYLTGQAKDGTHFAFIDDEFYVVWTTSNQG